MLEVQITITAADLTAAINNLASALKNSEMSCTVEPAAIESAAQVTEQNKTVVPVAAPATPATQTAPVQPRGVPTAAPQYTLEMIATAGSSLIDAGKLDQLMALLAKYGVKSLTELAPELYGAVASELRALGANI